MSNGRSLHVRTPHLAHHTHTTAASRARFTRQTCRRVRCRIGQRQTRTSHRDDDECVHITVCDTDVGECESRHGMCGACVVHVQDAEIVLMHDTMPLLPSYHVVVCHAHVIISPSVSLLRHRRRSSRHGELHRSHHLQEPSLLLTPTIHRCGCTGIHHTWTWTDCDRTA